MEYQLPSYQEATTRRDWLDIVLPYVDVGDYFKLLFVSKRFYSKIAPRLWQNPLRSIHSLGLDWETGKIY